MNTRQNCVLHQFKELHCLFPAHRREILQKHLQTLTCLKVFDQRLNGHTSSSENRSTAHHIWCACDNIGDVLLQCHILIITASQGRSNA